MWLKKKQVVYNYKEFNKFILDTLWEQQKANPNNIIIESGNILKIVVEPNTTVINRNRTEINLNKSEFITGKRMIYSWDFMINTKDMEPFKENKWRIIGQWHDRPEKEETWEEYNSKLGGGHPPPIAIELFQEGEKWMIGIRYGLQFGEKNYDKSINNRRIVAKDKIKTNSWNSIKVEINWSLEQDGFVNVTFNDNKMTPQKIYGINMFNEEACAFKLGIYRAKGFISEDTI